MSPANNFNRTTRKYFVYIVIAMLAALIYANRKSFEKVAGGGVADVGACQTLCGAALGGLNKGEYKFYADGSMEDEAGKFGAGSAGAKQIKALACDGAAGGAAAAAPSAALPRRR